MWGNCLDPDEMSLVVIDSYLVDAGYLDKLQVTSLDAYRRKNGCYYYWKLEEKQLKSGLKKLTSDEDVLSMGTEVVSSVVDVYLIKDANYDEVLMQCQVAEHNEKDMQVEEEDTTEVRHRDKQMVVDLNNQTCTCRKWELSVIPCSHAISCFAMMQDSPENYVHTWYQVENYMKAYGVHISPMVGLESWQKTDRPAINPPHVNIEGNTKKGRRKTMRIKGPEETVERPRKHRAYTVKGTSQTVLPSETAHS
ncbi:hypothetical protein LINPERPRIM_LOCUS11189 [Linum perenne]